MSALLAHPAVRAQVAYGLRDLRRHSAASSTHAARALLLAEPPSIDSGELTDKGYINQGSVLRRRKALVEALYAPDHADVIGPSA